jgi:hypothetical protein
VSSVYWQISISVFLRILSIHFSIYMEKEFQRYAGKGAESKPSISGTLYA